MLYSIVEFWVVGILSEWYCNMCICVVYYDCSVCVWVWDIEFGDGIVYKFFFLVIFLIFYIVWGIYGKGYVNWLFIEGFC